MPDKNSKKSYYLPDALTDFFAEWCSPGRDYSSNVAGALLVWMGLPPELRELARKSSANANVKKNVGLVAQRLHKNVIDSEIQRFLDSLSMDKKAQVLADIKASKGKLGQK